MRYGHVRCCTFDVTKERICAEGVVIGAAVVMDKRVSSNGSVLCTSGVEKQCSTADCGVIIRLVESQRSGANSGVGGAGGSGKQRIPANSCICRTGGEGF